MSEEQAATVDKDRQSTFSRRTFLTMAGAVAAFPALAACGSTGGSSSNSSGGSSTYTGKPLKLWNQPWGSTYFNTVDKQITEVYKPAKSLPSATYQLIPWANVLQIYTSAISSNTGPAVSSGTGTQAFLFSSQGYIAYADNLLDQWKKNGLYDDFLPGLLDTMKTKNGYAGIPYNLDVRMIWYNPSLLEKAGASVPTDWQSYLDTCAALKKIGVYGFGVGSGTGDGIGPQAIVALMINNGGGLFDAHQQPNCVTKANIEAVDFVLEMVSKGYVDPASPTYTATNEESQWAAEKWGMGMNSASLGAQVGGTVGPTLKVGNPLVGSTGKKGTLYFPNNIMMYKNTPSQAGSEAFLTYYYKHLNPIWTQNKTGAPLPVLKSLSETSDFKSNDVFVKAIKVWYPVGHTWAWPGGNSLFLGVTTVDGPPVLTNFAQAILGGKTDAKSALQTVQNTIKANWPKSGGS